MANVYNDVLRVCESTVADALPNKLLNKQLGFATDTKNLTFKDPGGVVYYCPNTTHRHDGHTLQHDGVNSDGGAFAFTTTGTVTFAKTITLTTCVNAGADVDKFMVLDTSNNVDFRTGAEVLSDIGGSATTHRHDGHTLQHDRVNSNGGAFPFDTTGDVTFNQNLEVTKAQNASTGITIYNSTNDTNADAYMEVQSGTSTGILGAFPLAETNYTEYQGKIVLWAVNDAAALALVSEAAAGEIQCYVGGDAAGDKIATFTTTNLTMSVNKDVLLSGTGHVTSGSEGFIVGTLTITDGSIDDTDGSIALGATNLTGVGTIGCGAITSTSTIEGTYLGVGVAPNTYRVNILPTSTDLGGILVEDLTFNTTVDFIGVNVNITKTAGATAWNDDLTAGQFIMRHDHATNIGHIRGLQGGAYLVKGTCDNGRWLNGLLFACETFSGTTVEGQMGGIYMTTLNRSGATVIGDFHGMYLKTYQSGTCNGTSYGVYLNDSGLDFGYYQTGTTKNRLGGDLQIDSDTTGLILGATQNVKTYCGAANWVFDAAESGTRDVIFTGMTTGVGIGTTSPKADLQIGSVSTQSLIFNPTNTGISNNIWWTGAAYDSIDHGEVGTLLQFGGGDLAFRHFTAADPPVGTCVLFVDGSANAVGICTAAPGATLDISGTDGVIVPIGTTAQRVATQGIIRYNTDTSKFEGYTGAAWVDFH